MRKSILFKQMLEHQLNEALNNGGLDTFGALEGIEALTYALVGNHDKLFDNFDRGFYTYHEVTKVLNEEYHMMRRRLPGPTAVDED